MIDNMNENKFKYQFYILEKELKKFGCTDVVCWNNKNYIDDGIFVIDFYLKFKINDITLRFNTSYDYWFGYHKTLHLQLVNGYYNNLKSRFYQHVKQYVLKSHNLENINSKTFVHNLLTYDSK